MVKRNENFAKLQAGYLFPEIGRRRRELLEREPDAKVISLGIGDTTEPVTPHITAALTEGASRLGTQEGYSGYGPEQGIAPLREKIAEVIYDGMIEADEVFVSDGAKCDIGRIQVLFGPNAKFAVQDPSYPVYVDGGVILGQATSYNSDKGQYDDIAYLSCTPENNFFPDLEVAKGVDVIYFNSPNNPTGAVSTHEDLKRLVDFAKGQGSIIVFDAAYAFYLQDQSLPKSIFEIEGAKEVAIECNSFSKPAGFTGVRLGWTVVPKTVKFEDGTPVHKDWTRVMTTIFNGASNIVQHGGLALLEDEGMAEMKKTVSYYMENAKIIKSALDGLGFETYGGDNTPYIWTRFPGRDSWEVFEEILNKAHVVTTPGSGFGPAGEGFVRFSAFGRREDIEEAVQRLKEVLG